MCKIFGLKIRSCKFFNKSQVCHHHPHPHHRPHMDIGTPISSSAHNPAAISARMHEIWNLDIVTLFASLSHALQFSRTHEIFPNNKLRGNQWRIFSRLSVRTRCEFKAEVRQEFEESLHIAQIRWLLGTLAPRSIEFLWAVLPAWLSQKFEHFSVLTYFPGIPFVCRHFVEGWW